MRNIFCRIGSKTNISNDIIKLFPDHKIYVEPFFGSGAVYFHKNPSIKEIINDIDKDLINGYKLIKKVSSDINKYKNLDSLEMQQEFYNKKHITNEDKLLYYILKSCNTFCATGKGKIFHDRNQYDKLKNIEKYKERMINTTILSQDYKTIIKKYDSKETLFYLDPPYEKSNKQDLYNDNEINYNELANILKTIKGKFILSINDSTNIQKIFNDFNKKKIIINRTGNLKIGFRKRNDLLITNF